MADIGDVEMRRKHQSQDKWIQQISTGRVYDKTQLGMQGDTNGSLNLGQKIIPYNNQENFQNFGLCGTGCTQNNNERKWKER